MNCRPCRSLMCHIQYATLAPAELLTLVVGNQSGTKRRSPTDPGSQPTAKKGRLQLKTDSSDEQSDPDFMSDASPAPESRKAAGRTRRLVESDEDCSQASPVKGGADHSCQQTTAFKLCLRCITRLVAPTSPSLSLLSELLDVAFPPVMTLVLGNTPCVDVVVSIGSIAVLSLFCSESDRSPD